MTERLDPVAFRRRLRREQTRAEARVWAGLRRHHLGVKFRRQHTAGPYTLDFYCPRAKLCVELDGFGHMDAHGRARDGARDAYLAARGVRVLRFTDADVELAPEAVLEAVWSAVRERLA